MSAAYTPLELAWLRRCANAMNRPWRVIAANPDRAQLLLLARYAKSEERAVETACRIYEGAFPKEAKAN